MSAQTCTDCGSTARIEIRFREHRICAPCVRLREQATEARGRIHAQDDCPYRWCWETAYVRHSG